MAYAKKTWVNVPDPDSYTGDTPLSDLPRFDAENMNRIEEGIENSLQLNDGYIDEPFGIKSDDMPKIEFVAPNNFSEIVKNADNDGDFGLVLNDYADKNDTSDKVSLSLCHRLAKESIDGALRLIQRWDGGSKVYKVYGEHNKPTASDIGAISKTIYIDNKDILTVANDGWYYGTNMASVPTGNKAGYIRVMAFSRDYRVVYWRPHDSLKEYVNVFNGGIWLGWTEILTNNGGTLTGDLTIEKAELPSVILKNTTTGTDTIVKQDNNFTSIISRNKTKKNYRGLQIHNPDVVEDRNSLRTVKVIDGVITAHNVFGEHNKPSGTYNGAENGALKTVSVGGIGKVLLIYNTDNYVGFVFEYGAVFFECSLNGGASARSFNKNSINFKDGILTINAADNIINNKNVTYYYQLL